VSQSAESARDWINNASPNIEQLQQAAQAMQRKLNDHPSLNGETRENLTAALQQVTAEIDAQLYAKEPDSDTPDDAPAPADITPDTSPLGETNKHITAADNTPFDYTALGAQADPAIRTLNGSEKRAAFEQLKRQLKK